MTSFFSAPRWNIWFLGFDRRPHGLQLVDTNIKSDCDAINSFATTFRDNWSFPKIVVPNPNQDSEIGFQLLGDPN